MPIAKSTLIYQGQALHASDWLQRVAEYAAGLTALGLRRGDSMALWLPNCPEWIYLHLAAMELGVATVAVNTRFRSAEVADIVGRSEARALVYWPGFLGIDFDGILEDVDDAALSRVEHVLVYGEGESAQTPPRMVRGKPTHSLQAVRDHGAGMQAEWPRAQADDGCIMFTTSGTTGAPKLALHTRASILKHAQEVAPTFGYDQPATTLLQALPLCGTFGHAQAMSVLHAGGTLLLVSAFDLEQAIHLIEKHRVTAINGADTMFEDMMATARPEQFASVRDGGFAAFATPDVEDFVRRAEDFGIELFGLYGMSEVQALFARRRPGADIAVRAEGGGYLTSPHAAFRICDPDTGRELPRGEAGELHARGPSMFREYFNNPGATSAALTTGGFLRTGDLAVADDERSFTYLTRMGDSLRLGGFIASPAEIEAVIEQHASVRSCQVVGVEGERGTRPVAFVLASDGAEIRPDALHRHCADAMAKYKVPVRFIELDDFPRTDSPNGQKIQRVRLREMATEQLR